MARRTPEIGLRIALGACSYGIVSPILRQTAMASLVGIGMRVKVSLVVTRVLSSLLLEVSPDDPLSSVASAVAMLLVALAGGCWPARRSS